MGNGTEFVSWPVFKEHEEKAEQGFDRLARLEAEVMGDEMTHRPSLRVEFIVQHVKTRRTIILLVVALVVKWGWEYFAHIH